MDMIVLAPTRGRPERAGEMVESFLDTKTSPDTSLILVVDETDITRKGYAKYGHYKDVRVLHLWGDETGCLTKATNSAARRYWHGNDLIMGHVGDDHLFRTTAWDESIAEALINPGIAYGNDLLQGETLPTAVFMSSVIPRALGWYALPSTYHLYIDNAWKLLGEKINALHYLPDVVIEHMHPANGKAPMDKGYEEANSDITTQHDREAFKHWQLTSMGPDIKNVRKAIR